MTSAETLLDEHPVTPLELFFDLVFVFAITQVTSLLAHHPTRLGVLHGMLVLAAVWWAWGTYAWLTSALDVDEGGIRLAMLAATALMLGVALAVPGAFGADAVLFGIAYLFVRLLHFVLSAVIGRNQPDRLDVLVRFAPTAFAGALLILAAGLLDGNARLAAWIAALAIDYAGPTVVGMGQGWRVAPEHFAERYGLVILIALGESIIAIGVGAGFQLHAAELLAAALGALLVSALWWLYFDVAAIFARRRLAELQGLDRAKLARDAYTYLHLPMVAGIVLFALGLKTTVRHPGDELDLVPAAAMCGGAALYLSPTSAFSTARSAASSAAEPTPRSCCSPSSRSRPRSPHSPRRLSAASAPSWSPTRRSHAANTASDSATLTATVSDKTAHGRASKHPSSSPAKPPTRPVSPPRLDTSPGFCGNQPQKSMVFYGSLA